MNKLTKAQIEAILASRFQEDRCKSLGELPAPDTLKDCARAAKRIVRAIEQKERITVVGDYDVDGVVSSVIVSEFFDDLGVAYELIIPNRFRDGYGISPTLMERIDADLIITVDNGISAVEAAEICQDRGIDLIITDHHNIPPKLPKAYAIVNPKQEACHFAHQEICGAQVAWYLIAGIKQELQLSSYDLSKFLDLLAVAIVADMMELRGLNRVMVRAGFKKINQGRRIIFEAIKHYFNKSKYVSDDLSFLLSPLINSAGRMEDATLAYEMLRSRDFPEAMKRLDRVVSLNNRRKEIEAELTQEAIASFDEDDAMVIVWGEGWHEGVIGIVAARLCRRFQKPAIVFSVEGDRAKGSARSIGEIDILALISTADDLILGYGGHKGAAGLALKRENLEAFKARLLQEAQKIPASDFIDTSDLLGEIDAEAIDLGLVELLESFEPYGQKNPKPKFLLKNAQVAEDKLLGINQNHLKLSLNFGKKNLESIHFNFTQRAYAGEAVDLVCTIAKNEFRGDVSVQLIVDEIKPKSRNRNS